MRLARPASPGETRRLHWALGISIGLHALLLTLHFQFPETSLAVREQALDIILVNARSHTAPTQAQALAQNKLDGGGNSDDDRRAATPLPATRKERVGDQLEEARQRIRELETRQKRMLTQSGPSKHTANTRTALDQPQPTPITSGLDLAEAAKAMARLEGEISRSVDEYNKRPRKKFIGTRAEEYRFAQYIETWRQKVERVGTLNYPDAARGKLYGSLVMTIAINADGTLNRTPDINRSSGIKLLDEAAVRIVQLAAPYAPFPPDIRRDTDILEITRTWSFTQGDQLQTK